MEDLTAEDEKSLEKIVELLDADSMKRAKVIAKKLTITRSIFVYLILAAKSNNRDITPYCHKMSVYRSDPEHLIPTEKDKEAFQKNGIGSLKGKAQTLANKMFQTMEERKWVVGHLFYTKSLKFWHLFCFDIKDMNNDNNHWKVGGKHVHYVSSLWPNCSISEVWSRLQKGSKNFGSNVHIRFVE